MAKLKEWLSLWANLSPIVLALCSIVWYYHSEIINLDKRVTVLEKSQEIINSNVDQQNTSQDDNILHVQEQMSQMQQQMNQRFTSLDDRLNQILMFFSQNRMARK